MITFMIISTLWLPVAGLWYLYSRTPRITDIVGFMNNYPLKLQHHQINQFDCDFVHVFFKYLKEEYVYVMYNRGFNWPPPLHNDNSSWISEAQLTCVTQNDEADTTDVFDDVMKFAGPNEDFFGFVDFRRVFPHYTSTHGTQYKQVLLTITGEDPDEVYHIDVLKNCEQNGNFDITQKRNVMFYT